MIQIERITSENTLFKGLVRALDDDLMKRYGESQHQKDVFNRIESLDTVVIASVAGNPAGCGCFRRWDEHLAEIKRMYVKPEYRGTGLAQRILDELEGWAQEIGYTAFVLETGIYQPEAIRFYTKKGYRKIPNYGPYAGNESSVCLGKE
jgi:GNAT superfamily N-acetyltransferase